MKPSCRGVKTTVRWLMSLFRGHDSSFYCLWNGHGPSWLCGFVLSRQMRRWILRSRYWKQPSPSPRRLALWLNRHRLLRENWWPKARSVRTRTLHSIHTLVTQNTTNNASLTQCPRQVGSNLANAADDGQWSQGLISAVSWHIANRRVNVLNVNLIEAKCVSLAVGASGGHGHQQPVWGSKRLSARPRQRGEAHLFSQAGRSLHSSAAGGLQGEGWPGFRSHEEATGDSWNTAPARPRHRRVLTLRFPVLRLPATRWSELQTTWWRRLRKQRSTRLRMTAWWWRPNSLEA